MAASRITLQGEANLIKNRGVMGDIFNHDQNVAAKYTDAPPPTRLTHQAEDNCVKSRGTMGKYLNPPSVRQDKPSLSEPVNSRVTNQAEPNYVKGQGMMKKWMNVDENLESNYESPRPAPRACPTNESKTMKQKSGGSMSHYIGNEAEYRAIPIERKIHPRGVTRTAEATAETHKGGRMEKLLHSDNQVPTSPQRPGRVVKEEARDIAEKHDGRPMAKLITNYGNMPISDRAPRVTMWGEDNMALNQGGRAKTLINDQQKRETPRPVSTTSNSDSFNLGGEKVYGNRVDNYNKRNATQWTQGWS